MTTPTWQVSGQYFETCSCNFVCPCILGQMAVEPTHGSCTFAMAFKVEHGGYGEVPLDGLGFIVLGMTPEAMGKGNWSVGVIADERASAAQRDAITAIASQMTRSQNGDPTDRAICAGVRKMPTAITSPITSETAAPSPSCRERFIERESPPSRSPVWPARGAASDAPAWRRTMRRG